MFDKAKQLNELRKLRSQGKKLQNELGQITEILEKNRIKVRVRGDQKLDFLEINGEERDDVVEVINSAFKKVQKKAAKKMMEMGGGLSGLLGGLK